MGDTVGDILFANQKEVTQKELEQVQGEIRGKYSSDIINAYSPGGEYAIKSKGAVADFGGAYKESLRKPNINRVSSIMKDDLYADLSDGSRVAKYDNIPSFANSISQIDEYKASQQTTGDKWQNGLGKAGFTALTTVAGVTIGSIYGIINGVREGSLTSVFDNDFSRYTDDLNTRVGYKLPNFYSEQEKNMSLGQQMGTANFYADKMLGGASFTIGAIVGEGLWAAATGGASLSVTAARWGSKLSNIGKFGKYVSEAESIAGKAATVAKVGRLTEEAIATSSIMNKVMPTVKQQLKNAYSIEKLQRGLAIDLGKMGELTHTARFMYTSSAFEAGQEARNYMSEARKNYTSSFMEKNGRSPSREEYGQFNIDLVDSGNALFGFNMGILAPSNMLMMGKVMGVKSPIKTPDKWANNVFFGLGTKRAATGKLESLSANRLQKVLAKGYTIAGSPIREGGEEGLQSVGQTTAKSWLEATYDPRQTRNTIDLGVHFTNALSHTLNSTEGQTEMVIGAIIGLVSGTGISLVRGKGLFGSLKDARENVEKEVEVRNNYTAEKTLSRIHTANRVAYFEGQAEQAEEKGDVFGAELSRASSMIAHITNAHNFDSIDEAKEEFKVAVGTMDNEILKKQYGFETEDQIKDFKEALIEEHAALTKEYTKNRQYIDYMISSNPKELKGANNIEDIKEAIAFELTLGYKAHEFSGELLTDIQNSLAKNFNTTGQAMSDALKVTDILWSASAKTTQDFIATQNRLKAARKEEARLEKERVSLENSKNSKEDNRYDLNRLNAVATNIEVTQKEIAKLGTELEGLVSAAQLQNPYNNNSEVYISADQLENVDTNLKSITKLIQDYKSINPRETHRLEGVLGEYSKSKTAFTRYATLAKQLTDPELGLRGRRNIISELSSKKPTNEKTIDFLKTMGERYDEIKAGQELEQAEGAQGVQEVLNKNKMTPGVQTKKVATVQDIIDDNPYLMSYVGSADNAKVPTPEEIAEYKKLVSRIKRSKTIDNEKATRNAANYYAKKGIKTNLTAKEMARFQELNQKMADWRFFESALNSEGISMADLIEQEVSREKEVVPEQIQDELVVDDYVLVMTPSEVTSAKGEEFRKSAIVQTYENVKVQIIEGFYNFSHLKIESILSKLKGDVKIIMKTPKTFDASGFVTSWNKPIEVGLEDVRLNQDNYGTIFNLVSPTSDTQITVANRGKIQIPTTSFNAIKEEIGYDIFKPMATKTTYSDLYEVNAEGKLVQKDSDFKLEQELGATAVAYEAEEVFSMEPGTNTFFKLNIKDSYNQGLKDKYDSRVVEISEDTTMSLEDKDRAIEVEKNNVISQVKVYNTAANGKILGDMKSNQDIVDETTNFLEIRRLAADILLNKTPKQDLITIPMTAKAKFVMIGVPNITMIKTEDGIVPESRPITEKALEQVVDYGFMVGGQLMLKGDTKGVRMDFVSKLSKKTFQ